MQWHFEISWEVCHKQGGIYTAIKNKAAALMKKFQNQQIFMIGPYLPGKMDHLFLEQEKPNWLKAIEEDIQIPFCHFGKWNINGQPPVILFDFQKFTHDEQGIEQLIKAFCDNETNPYFHPLPTEIQKEMTFGIATMAFFRSFKKIQASPYTSAEFHEWQAACAIPLLKQENLLDQIIFTTHATQLGRISLEISALMAKGYNIHEAPEWMQKNQSLKHIIEQKAAEKADLFVTTSRTVAEESRNYLKVRADKIIPPGLNISALQSSAPSEKNRSVLDQYLLQHFPEHYTTAQKHFKLIIAARHEYHNKGFDITLKAMQFLNKKILQEKQAWRLTLFVIADGGYIGSHITDPGKIVPGQFDWFLSDKPLNTIDPIVKDIFDYSLDEKDMSIKTLYHPSFVSKDSCFGLDYLNLLSACDIGIFPSAYEPWGYTPIETLALGIPVAISKQSGLANYLQNKFPTLQEIGVFAVDRQHGNLEQQAQELADMLYELCLHHDTYRKNAIQFSQNGIKELDWENLLTNVVIKNDERL